MMNRYERNIFIRFNDFLFKNVDDRNKARLLLIIMSCILGLSITAFFISNSSENKSINSSGEIINGPSAPLMVNKTLVDTSAEYGLSFVVRSKWEDGKIYSNHFVRFNDKPIWSFKEWTFCLMDKDGYMIRKVNFTLNDLMFETRPQGRIVGLTGKTNDAITMGEFQKIKKLKVILDRKIEAEDF